MRENPSSGEGEGRERFALPTDIDYFGWTQDDVERELQQAKELEDEAASCFSPSVGGELRESAALHRRRAAGLARFLVSCALPATGEASWFDASTLTNPPLQTLMELKGGPLDGESLRHTPSLKIIVAEEAQETGGRLCLAYATAFEDNTVSPPSGAAILGSYVADDHCDLLLWQPCLERGSSHPR